MRALRWSLLLVAFVAGVAKAEKVASLPKPTGYVDDYAGVLNEATRSEVEAVCVEVHDKTKAQIFVVTVKTLEHEPVEQFANDLFHTWKIGEKKTDRGLLLLLAVQDHKYRIEVGYGLEGLLNDAKVGDLGRAMLPELREQDYDRAVEETLRPIALTIATDAGVTLDSLQPSKDAPTEVSTESAPPAREQPKWPWWAILAAGFFGLLFVAAFIGIIVAIVRGARNRSTPRRRNTYDDDDLRSKGSGISSDSSSSSSDSSSSSSESFSGGDGGDSGGGGASGSW